MFVVIVEQLTKKATPVGPFPHLEDADAWAQANLSGYVNKSGVKVPHIWRTAPLIAPADYK